jgi:hypothetical protein
LVEAAGIENVATPTKSSTYSQNRCLKSASWTFAYSGHGVTVAVLAGRLLRDLVAGEPLDPVYDFVLNRKPPRSPGEPLTSVGFGLAKRYIRWEDAR